MRALRPYWLDAALLAAAAALAAAVRAPYLRLIPRYTDEVKEVMWAVRIYRGEILPLAGHNGYSGPLWNYILAGLFATIGPSTGLPRIAACVAGCLTVVATYVLARVMADRTAAVVAAALMSCLFIPVYLNSHVAWSVCTAPLFATAALTAFHVGVTRSRGWWVVLTGLLVALTMQAHPLGVLLVPAMVVWGVWRQDGRRLLRTRWPYLGAAAAVAAYANMLWYHASSGGETVSAALAKLSDGIPQSAGGAGFAGALWALLTNLVDLLDARSRYGLHEAGIDPGTLTVAGLLALFGVLAFAARRRSGLPLATVATTAALMPLFNDAYSYPLGGRYLSFLLPVICTGAGLAASAVLHAARRRGGTMATTVTLVLTAALSLFAIQQVHALREAYRQERDAGRTNALVLEMARLASEASRRGDTVLLSETIEAKFAGGGHLHRVMATLLSLSDVPYTLLDAELQGADAEMDRCRPACVLVLSETHRRALGEHHALAAIPLSSAPLNADGESYGLYRYSAAP
jgi:4-amino-4-deoxy-L-arabinose transferase-like glycosyltransferase